MLQTLGTSEKKINFCILTHQTKRLLKYANITIKHPLILSIIKTTSYSKLAYNCFVDLLCIHNEGNER